MPRSRSSDSEPFMELRKVQLTGGSSITVTLPKGWVDKAELRAGDVVRCIEQPDGSLAVHPHTKGERAPQQHVISLDGQSDRDLFRQIVASYLMGYDVILIRGKGPLSADNRTTIRNAVRRIIGLEIIDEDASSISVQDFLNPRDFHMGKALRRMAILTQAMQEEAFISLAKPKHDAAKSSQDRDDEIDKLYWLINKQYHAMLRDTSYATSMGLTTSEALNYLLLARLVERTADHADRIVRQSLAFDRTPDLDSFVKKLAKQGRKAAELFQEALKAFQKPDAKKANQIIDEADKFAASQEKLLREAANLQSDALSHLAFVIESIGRTAAYAADVGEITINHVVGQAG